MTFKTACKRKAKNLFNFDYDDLTLEQQEFTQDEVLIEENKEFWGIY